MTSDQAARRTPDNARVHTRSASNVPQVPAPHVSRRPPAPTTRGIDEDPAVLTWRIALAPRPRHIVGRHWWRDLVWNSWHAAYNAWWLDREQVASGYATEMAEYEAEHPCPRLGDHMRALSSGSQDTYDYAMSYHRNREPLVVEP